MIFRQLFDPQSSTYTYLLADEETREAIIIDPVFEQVRREIALIEELGLKLVASLETHVHADHVTGAWLLKERLASQIALSRKARASGVDVALAHGDKIQFGNRFVRTLATPGHTDGCTSYVLDDNSAVFTGDALLIRGCGRTDFQQGNAEILYRSIHEHIFTLPNACMVYPGHDYNGLTASSIGEEKQFNPRLGGKIGEADFKGFMDNLGLPHPKMIDIAVPANLKCGRPDRSMNNEIAWAPVHVTFAGVPEILPQWVEENWQSIQIIDVRDPEEFNGTLRHAPGAILIPIGQLPGRLTELDRDKPLAIICRSGARSARATLFLLQNGFSRVANVTGGMLRWRSENLTVE